MMPTSVLAEKPKLTPEVCRESMDYDVVADCIEKKIDDPCMRAGGKGGDAQCGYGGARVAERRITRAMKVLREAMAEAGVGDKQAALVKSQRAFESFRLLHCGFANDLRTISDATQTWLVGTSWAFCVKDLNEWRARQLETLMVLPENRDE